ncbi:hypothetical protein F4679DRAFT_577154 [Xylaria curta]|nr:hypothetical protein F4679DRAFT_577154 [Xylaria curta]
MYCKTPISIAMAAVALYAGTATAIWDCRTDQHVYDPTEGKFVVHYTSIRDTEYNGQPWIRVCLPEISGDWNQLDPFQTPCASNPATIISKAKTGLNDDLVVTNGDGCDTDASGLSGASIAYGDQVINLASSGGACGPRDHGITCQFDA